VTTATTSRSLAGDGGLLARIVAFDRALHERAALRTTPTPIGLALFHDPAPTLWDLNAILVDDADADFAELAAVAEEVQRGLPHRMLILDADARRQASDARAAGWTVERHVAMVPRRAPDRPPPPHEVAELPAARTAAARRAAMRDEPGGDLATIESVLAANEALSAARREREFASLEAGEPAGMAKLFSDETRTIGQVEDVVTVPASRNHGHARAVVTAALEASRAAGHDLTFLWADEDDWPRLLYGRMGWDVVGRRWRLRRVVR